MENNTDQSGSTTQPSESTAMPETAAPAAASPEVTLPPMPTVQPMQSSPEAQPTSSTPAAPANKAKGGGMMKKLLLVILAILIPVGAFLGYYMSNQSATKKENDLKNQISVLTASEHDLPAGATKASDCIPNMGFHYLPKGADDRYGPFLLVNKQNKVIGVEYMASKDMYTAIPGTNPPVEFVTKDSPMYGWKFDHFEITHLPQGHEGLPVDHNDVHLYTVPASVEKNACV